jgi:hypothetical protein
MGMAEQKTWLQTLYAKANDIYLSRKERTKAWCEWGRMSKNVHDMAKALREISVINDRE